MNTQRPPTLGSLFDGIGGFPYAGLFFGIKPLWASEIQPSAISVTRRHLPGMAHVGDITKLRGGDLPPVDIITFGSPCQGLSHAGKRLGLADERSGLFSEAIRIIREMQEATHGQYPRYALWENVPGALSSGKPAGSDFQAVLEAFTKTEIPFPRSGKWANAGMVRSRGADLAWCVYNAQHFGTAQRRRRIFLVVDFGGGCAGEILFIPQSLRGYFAAGGTPRQGPAAYAQNGSGTADFNRGVGFDGYNGDLTGARAATLGVNCGMSTGRNGVLTPDEGTDHLHTGTEKGYCLTPWDVQSRRIHTPDGTWPALYGGEGGGRGYCLNPWDTQQTRVTDEEGVSPTLAGADGGGGRNPAGLVFTAAFCHKAGAKAQGIGFEEERSPTLTGITPSVLCLNDQGGDSMSVEKSDTAPTLRSETHGNLPVICAATVQANSEICADLCPTLTEAAGTSGNNKPYICKAVHQNQAGEVSTADTAYTLSTASNASARNAPLVMTEAYGIAATAIGRQPHNGGNGLGVQKEISPTLTATDRHAVGGTVHPEVSGTLCASGAGLSRPAGMASETDLCVAYCLQGNMVGRQDQNGPRGDGINEEIAYTLTGTDVHSVAKSYSMQRSDEYKANELASTQAARQYKSPTDLVCSAVDCRNYKEIGDLSGTLQAKDKPGYSLNYQNPVRTGYIVRRLTPTECERLQGYPDGWTALDEHGKPISDTKRYQMLGNSVAVPCVAYILQSMARQLTLPPGKEAA